MPAQCRVNEIHSNIFMCTFNTAQHNNIHSGDTGCVRAFPVRFDFTHRMRYSYIGQFSASNTAINIC